MSSESLVIYSVNRVGKIAQSAPNKQILRDISLGFYYGFASTITGMTVHKRSWRRPMNSRLSRAGTPSAAAPTLWLSGVNSAFLSGIFAAAGPKAFVILPPAGTTDLYASV
jgi:hypothetical protein